MVFDEIDIFAGEPGVSSAQNNKRLREARVIGDARVFACHWPAWRVPNWMGVLEASVYLSVIAAFVAVSYVAYDKQLGRKRSQVLCDTLVQEAARLQQRVQADQLLPPVLDPHRTPPIPLNYRVDERSQSFALSGSLPALGIWAGVNGRGLRCVCRDCAPPSRFAPAQRSCPDGTGPF